MEIINIKNYQESIKLEDIPQKSRLGPSKGELHPLLGKPNVFVIFWYHKIWPVPWFDANEVVCSFPPGGISMQEPGR